MSTSRFTKALCIGTSAIALVLSAASAQASGGWGHGGSDDDIIKSQNDVRLNGSADSMSFDKNTSMNASGLQATVSNNSTVFKLKDNTFIDGNLIKDTVQQYARGINAINQNVGMNASNQQSIAVRGDVNVQDSSRRGGHHPK